MIRTLTAAALTAMLALPAYADFEYRSSNDDVATVMDRLEQAVRAAGAMVVARVDHSGAAEGVGMELDDAELLIFGNPQLGTQAMQEDIRAGLFLPLRILVYRDGDETVIFWQEPEEMLDDLDIDDDAEYLERMEEALETFAEAAAG
ncbi:DUF302 domain-containing protein [Alterinioella nitratireducens]|uniref:DUF302 domain-containing protein n=1 Tax=Alterinioella nitratireducens TaxID=2735915 RepID=UPI004058213D